MLWCRDRVVLNGEYKAGKREVVAVHVALLNTVRCKVLYIIAVNAGSACLGRVHDRPLINQKRNDADLLDRDIAVDSDVDLGDVAPACIGSEALPACHLPEERHINDVLMICSRECDRLKPALKLREHLKHQTVTGYKFYLGSRVKQ